jgi:DNA polymerase III delta prime subunit
MSLFVEVYRPQNLDEFVGNESLKKTIAKYLEEGNIQNLLFHGSAGCGKTTLAKLIVSNLQADCLYINASDERSIDTIRDKIVPFASSMGFGGVKIVILDEADYLTPQAQASLRNTIESLYANCRFILTCNYVSRIIDPLQSRCKSFNVIPPSKKEVALHIANILQKEEVKFEPQVLKDIINKFYPDLRETLNFIQGEIHDGVLEANEALGMTKQVGKLVDAIINIEKLPTIRQHAANLSLKESDQLFTALYNRVDDFKSPAEAIIIINQSQYEYNFVLDKEICIMAMIVKLLNI